MIFIKNFFCIYWVHTSVLRAIFLSALWCYHSTVFSLTYCCWDSSVSLIVISLYIICMQERVRSSGLHFPKVLRPILWWGSWEMTSEPLEYPDNSVFVCSEPGQIVYANKLFMVNTCFCCLRLWATLYQFDLWGTGVWVAEVSHAGTACLCDWLQIETLMPRLTELPWLAVLCTWEK